MMPPTDVAILAAVNEIGDPCSAAHGQAMGIGDMGLVESVEREADGTVLLRLRLTSPCCGMVGYFSEEAKRRVASLGGVASVEVIFDQGLDWTPSMMSERSRAGRARS